MTGTPFVRSHQMSLTCSMLGYREACSCAGLALATLLLRVLSCPEDMILLISSVTLVLTTVCSSMMAPEPWEECLIQPVYLRWSTPLALSLSTLASCVFLCYLLMRSKLCSNLLV